VIRSISVDSECRQSEGQNVNHRYFVERYRSRARPARIVATPLADFRETALKRWQENSHGPRMQRTGRLGYSGEEIGNLIFVELTHEDYREVDRRRNGHWQGTDRKGDPQTLAAADRAFISFNCAATPPSLIASELFGHEKGRFTRAVQ
jgi:transcriptional regulator of acetoin/glycerol metabolism